ncbi:hypothetical protein MTR67_014741 [Solanum verrucosum]|uniref:Uncharacterized protein n=1 Tax=Solanum verrucosum TaxID=315347 RepID=A0AAF0QIQ5_SOLVR|nr:hypothetical protein MTR67_014741 [Solanum verrucosum]
MILIAKFKRTLKNNLNIHASAASDNPSTCDESFSGPPAESPQLKDASDKVQGLIGIILGISNQLKG